MHLDIAWYELPTFLYIMFYPAVGIAIVVALTVLGVALPSLSGRDRKCAFVAVAFLLCHTLGMVDIYTQNDLPGWFMFMFAIIGWTILWQIVCVVPVALTKGIARSDWLLANTVPALGSVLFALIKGALII